MKREKHETAIIVAPIYSYFSGNSHGVVQFIEAYAECKSRKDSNKINIIISIYKSQIAYIFK